MLRVKNNKRMDGNKAQDRVASLCDDVAEFSRFREDILPFLRKAIAEGMTAEQIYLKTQALAAARAVTIAATEEDPGKAMTAIKDILDRAQGKAKERVEVNHKFKDLTDSELDAMLLTSSNEVEETDVGPSPH
jgi:hypothetical protein